MITMDRTCTRILAFVATLFIFPDVSKSAKLRRDVGSLENLEFEVNLLRNTIRAERGARLKLQQEMTGIKTRLSELEQLFTVPGRSSRTQFDNSRCKEDVFNRNIATLLTGLAAEKARSAYLEQVMFDLEILVRSGLNSTRPIQHEYSLLLQQTNEPATCCQSLNNTALRFIDKVGVLSHEVKSAKLDLKNVLARLDSAEAVNSDNGKQVPKKFTNPLRKFLDIFKSKN